MCFSFLSAIYLTTVDGNDGDDGWLERAHCTYGIGISCTSLHASFRIQIIQWNVVVMRCLFENHMHRKEKVLREYCAQQWCDSFDLVAC